MSYEILESIYWVEICFSTYLIIICEGEYSKNLSLIGYYHYKKNFIRIKKMKNDGLTFLLIVVAIIGIARMIWSYINLVYEVQDLRKRLGKS